MAKDDFEQILSSVNQLAVTCLPDMGHTVQVTRLALELFDDLTALHKLGTEERFWLECGAMLHDIGWTQGWKSHHKNSMKMILDSQFLQIGNKQRYIIASIARYHRKALPDVSHDHYKILQPSERRIVSKLAAILRIADGLDRTHQNLVEHIKVEIKKKEVIFDCEVAGPAPEEIRAANNKADLFEKVFKRPANIRIAKKEGKEVSPASGLEIPDPI